MNDVLFYIAESVVDACFEIADYIVDTSINFWENNQLVIAIIVGGFDILFGAVLANGGCVMF